ncbi:MAG: YtxH domain-containing protein [Candidatus Dadabacteria bacterium]
MNKILLGALVCAAVAGVVYYLYDPETFNETVGDLKDKGKDAYGKVKDILGKQADKAMSGAMS